MLYYIFNKTGFAVIRTKVLKIITITNTRLKPGVSKIQ